MRRIITWLIKQKRVSSKNNTKTIFVFFAVVSVAAAVFFCEAGKFSFASDITVENVVLLSNASRAEKGKPALSENSKLARAAEAKAQDMIANDYFSHTSPAGVTPWNWIEEEDYDYNYAGENLAMDFHSAEKMEEAWMASPTHRANILNEKYREIGVAIKEGRVNGQSTTIAVVMFGSGDRNLSSAADTKKEITDQKEIKTKVALPQLPDGERKKETYFVQQPMITIPQSGEIISDSKVRIAGRAKPGELVSIYDNETLVASAVGNDEGWFTATETNLYSGKHELTIEGKNISSEAKTVFFVDQEKPDVEFHLYADKNDPEHFFVKARTNKRNCTFQMNREVRKATRQGEVLFAIGANESSVILRIQDEAGNKNFAQIYIASYHATEKENYLSQKLTALLTSTDNVFSYESGREAFKNNLGIVPNHFFASRFKDKE